MTYSLSVSGSMNNLGDESVIEEAAREMLGKLEGVTYAALSTTHGGAVNLLEQPQAVEEVDPQIPGAGDVNSGDPGDEQPE